MEECFSAHTVCIPTCLLNLTNDAEQTNKTQQTNTTMGVINKFWKPAINFRKFLLPCPALRYWED